MLAKCGEIVVWHWAHLPNTGHECSSAGESEWHLKWKWWALQHGCQVEVRFNLWNGRIFRADIVTPKDAVVELQSKPPSYPTIVQREAAYGDRLRWLFRISAKQQERIKWGKTLRDGGMGFRFKRGPKRMTLCQRPTYFDLERDGELMKVNLTCKPSFYDPTREVMLGVARESDWRALLDYRSEERFSRYERRHDNDASGDELEPSDASICWRCDKPSVRISKSGLVGACDEHYDPDDDWLNLSGQDGTSRISGTGSDS